MNLRSFTYGIIIGVVLFVGSLAMASWVLGIKWVPIGVNQ